MDGWKIADQRRDQQDGNGDGKAYFYHIYIILCIIYRQTLTDFN